ncbi:hypothetical protein N7492_001318 [Penicillium capsulatum]|uniref:Inosine triphosphate pyrophosphatase n=1 Tax=Penicillium capsulatum TaxID=69766 RepID=A0A9W9ITK0_9EURO|nr:hypothetical protein N7492_001318 [Penicillium capsulatum]KAJ6129623.1 hypothetical protein N7512_002403 [Penicillium capsulatum]
MYMSLARMRACTFVTGNPNKVIEVNAILGQSIPVKPVALDVPEIQGTLEEIARDKCQRASRIVDGPVIVEDSALEFRAMKGLPGPYIKYFLEAVGNDGLNRLLQPYSDKSAEAVCTFAFSSGPTMEPLIFQGRLLGKIVPARGPPIFGWEPIFEHQGETLAEMAHDKKNRLSHRYQALRQFQEWLAQDNNRSILHESQES